ncbi:MAG: response regulator transcription factor [Candidatus Sericytochromatia bacterium]
MTEIHMIDDDLDISELLQEYFEGSPYKLTHSEEPIQGIEYIKNNKVALVILDLMLPTMDGFDVCKKIRENDPLIPIIMLTAKKDDFNKIVGLELGADDYMSKPFNPRELMARIKTILRRFEKTSDNNNINNNSINLVSSPNKDLILNLDSREVSFKGEYIEFTATEFDLLKCLVENVGIVQSRDNLMNKVKGIDFESFDRSIDVFISKIRQKLDDKTKGELIKTVRGIGYVFSKQS